MGLGTVSSQPLLALDFYRQPKIDLDTRHLAVHMVLHGLSLIRATILIFSNGTSSSDRSGLCTLHHAFQSSEDIHAIVRLASLQAILVFYRIFRCTLTRFQRSVGIDYITTQRQLGSQHFGLRSFTLNLRPFVSVQSLHLTSFEVLARYYHLSTVNRGIQVLLRRVFVYSLYLYNESLSSIVCLKSYLSSTVSRMNVKIHSTPAIQRFTKCFLIKLLRSGQQYCHWSH